MSPNLIETVFLISPERLVTFCTSAAIMSTPARRRLMSDFKCLQENLIPGVNAAPTNENILQWYAVIIGPHETPFEDGTFRLSIEFSEEYPNKPPLVKFITPIFHPNVYETGDICLDVLQNRWSPIYNVSAILGSIQSLLGDPNADSPANAEAANLFQTNPLEYEKRIQKYVERSWIWSVHIGESY